MKNLGKVLKLYISKDSYDGRINQSEVGLDKNGVAADKFYGKDIKKSILLTSINTYDLVKDNGIEIKEGELGENILVDFNLDKLTIGSKFQIGDNALLEITQACTVCNSLSKIDKSLPKLLKKDRGIFAKVVKRGIIKEGDKIKCV